MLPLKCTDKKVRRNFSRIKYVKGVRPRVCALTHRQMLPSWSWSRISVFPAARAILRFLINVYQFLDSFLKKCHALPTTYKEIWLEMYFGHFSPIAFFNTFIWNISVKRLVTLSVSRGERRYFVPNFTFFHHENLWTLTHLPICQ